MGKGVSSPIIGATKAHYLDDASAALKVKLSPQEIDYLEEIMCLIPLWGQLIEIQTRCYAAGCEAFVMLRNEGAFK